MASPRSCRAMCCWFMGWSERDWHNAIPSPFLPLFPLGHKWGGGARKARDGGVMPRTKQPRNTAKARQLRREMSLPEVLLWNLLRLSPEGVHFRRQHALGKYFLDFYCARAKLCIELDGIAHDMGNRPQRDEVRSCWRWASRPCAYLRPTCSNRPRMLLRRWCAIAGVEDPSVTASRRHLPICTA